MGTYDGNGIIVLSGRKLTTPTLLVCGGPTEAYHTTGMYGNAYSIA